MKFILTALIGLASVTAKAASWGQPADILVRSFSAQKIELLKAGHLPAPKVCRLSLWREAGNGKNPYYVLRFENGQFEQPEDLLVMNKGAESGATYPLGAIQLNAEGNSTFNHLTTYDGTTLLDQYSAVLSMNAPDFDQKMETKFVVVVDPKLTLPQSLDVVQSTQAVVRSGQFPLAALPVYFARTVAEVRCSEFVADQP